MHGKLLPTTVVGSYPQPDWLIDRPLLGANTPPRVRMRQLWRVAAEFLEEAQDDATLIAIRDQERAGIDIVSDGEMRRESYFNRFATALDGIDLDNPGTVISRTGKPALVPRVIGRVRRLRPVNMRDVQFLRANTDRQIKITVPGPFTMTKLAQNDYYASDAELAMDYAAAVNARDPRPLCRRRGRRADRRAVHASAARRRAVVWNRGARARARWNRRDNRGSHLLWLRRDGQGEAGALRLSFRTGCNHRAAGLRRNGAVGAGLFRAGRARRQDRSARGS